MKSTRLIDPSEFPSKQSRIADDDRSPFDTIMTIALMAPLVVYDGWVLHKLIGWFGPAWNVSSPGVQACSGLFLALAMVGHGRKIGLKSGVHAVLALACTSTLILGTGYILTLVF